MTETTAATVPPLASFLRPELPIAALHGLPGEVAVSLADSTGADPAAVLLTFLALLGNAAGPQPHARFGGADHPGRLFVVLVGDAAYGRKGTALGAVERLFAEADPDWAESRVLYGLQSGEAMIDRVADEGRGGDCRLLVVETEFARLAETMARTGTLSAHLRNAWDGRTLQRVGVRRTQQASRAHVSLVAMITPEELLKHHTRLSQAGGLESRILYVYTAPGRETSPFTANADTADLAERVRGVLETSRERVMDHTDPISRYLLTVRGIQPRVELPVSGDVTGGWGREVKARLAPLTAGGSAMHSRAEAQVIRLARPEPGNSCGFYAWKLDQPVPFKPGQWLLEVDLYGHVVEHERGYRAQKQRILRASPMTAFLCQPPFRLVAANEDGHVKAVCPSCSEVSGHTVTLERLRSLLNVEIDMTWAQVMRDTAAK